MSSCSKPLMKSVKFKELGNRRFDLSLEFALEILVQFLLELIRHIVADELFEQFCGIFNPDFICTTNSCIGSDSPYLVADLNGRLRSPSDFLTIRLADKVYHTIECADSARERIAETANERIVLR